MFKLIRLKGVPQKIFPYREKVRDYPAFGIFLMDVNLFVGINFGGSIKKLDRIVEFKANQQLYLIRKSSLYDETIKEMVEYKEAIRELDLNQIRNSLVLAGKRDLGDSISSAFSKIGKQ
jgi:hypothetical protein